MKTCKHLLLLIVLFSFSTPSGAAVYLTFNSGNLNQLSRSYDGTTGITTFTTKGNDPYIYLNALPRDLASDETMLYIEYNCRRTVRDFKIYYGNDYTEERSKAYGHFTTTGGEWQTLQIDLSREMKQFGWGKKGQTIRFDFGINSGFTIQIRQVKIRAIVDEKDDYKTGLNNHLQQYLGMTPQSSAKLDSVIVERQTVRLKGSVPAEGSYSLAEIPMYQDVTELSTYLYEEALPNGDFEISLPRNVRRSNYQYDRLLSKWAIVEREGEIPHLLTHAHYADSIYARGHAREMVLRGKKGLGGFFMNGNLGDLDALDIKSVTVNMVVSAYISARSGTFSNSQTFNYSGHVYYINMNEINALDNTLKECYKRGIITSAIILVSKDMASSDMKTIMIHPEHDGGYYSMPNLTTLESTCAYAAIISFLAERYSKGTYGRINHWIMHNEVDFSKEWTNMGDQTVTNYMDTYVKSMRLVSNIARQYDQNAWVLGSYTHSWTDVSPYGPGYSTLNMLGLTKQYAQAEGDFPWGVAFHPYPQDLTQPRFWVNDNQSTYSMNSRFCTFKNLEVINAWILDWDNFYKGQRKRLLFLSENGTNSPDYSTAQLNYQAAGACWAWKKVAALPGIDGIQWHNWMDNRAEFGLRIGLRRYTDDAQDPNGPKPVWYVWQAAETEREDEIFAPYLSIIGYKSWDAIFDKNLVNVPKIGETDRIPVDNSRDGVYTLSGVRVASNIQCLPKNNMIYIVRIGARIYKKLW
jgi:hypothetical protein